MIKPALIAAMCWLAIQPATAEPTGTRIESFMSKFRDMIGRPLMDTAVKFSNDTGLILEKIAPQGANLFFGASEGKNFEETFDQLRSRTGFSVALIPCRGSETVNAKIATVIAWERMADYQATLAMTLQRLLVLENAPTALAAPSTMRSPRGSSLRGLVFEYVKSETTETVALVNDGSIQSDPLMISWQATSNTLCPRP